jgi:hypothetical protein
MNLLVIIWDGFKLLGVGVIVSTVLCYLVLWLIFYLKRYFQQDFLDLKKKIKRLLSWKPQWWLRYKERRKLTRNPQGYVLLTFTMAEALTKVLNDFLCKYKMERLEKRSQLQVNYKGATFSIFVEEGNCKIIMSSGEINIPVTLRVQRIKGQKEVLGLNFANTVDCWVYDLPPMLLLHDVDFEIITGKIS